MSGNIVVGLPSSVAEDLVSAGSAKNVPPIRGGDLGDLIRVTVDFLNTGAAVVTMAMGAKAARDIARSLLRQRGEHKPATITVTVTRGRDSHSLTVRTDESVAEESVRDFLHGVTTDSGGAGPLR